MLGLSNLTFPPFISIPEHPAISVSLSLVPCSAVSSLASSKTYYESIFLSSYFEVSEPFKTFLSKALAVKFG